MEDMDGKLQLGPGRATGEEKVCAMGVGRCSGNVMSGRPGSSGYGASRLYEGSARFE